MTWGVRTALALSVTPLLMVTLAGAARGRPSSKALLDRLPINIWVGGASRVRHPRDDYYIYRSPDGDVEDIYVPGYLEQFSPLRTDWWNFKVFGYFERWSHRDNGPPEDVARISLPFAVKVLELNRSVEARREAILMIADHGRAAASAIDDVLRASDDKDPQVAEGAADALAAIGTPLAMRRLRELLRSPRLGVALASAQDLLAARRGPIGPMVSEVLLRCLGNESLWDQAAITIAELGRRAAPFCRN